MSSVSGRKTNSVHWKRLRQQILRRDNWTCYLCGNEADTVDHIHPLALGGTDDEFNLAAACKRCNFSKQGRVFFTPVSTARIPRHLNFPETVSKSHE